MASHKKIDRNCVHLAGEFFVAAELCKRGYNVALTMGNAKAIDILAEKRGGAALVQVKSVQRKTGWPIMKDKIEKNVVYVLVCLNEPGEPPSYSIMTEHEARESTKQYPTRGVICHATAMKLGHREAWHKVEEALRHSPR
ncbi:MAG: hypothetical protein AB1772_06365 [Candidatus Zixiibacteriota bacterium]